jgi:hypothetical protein
MMWPWGHLALGYLCYSLYRRFVAHRSPPGVAALALAFGTQWPDMIDKPLAWSFSVLPNGRSLGHSLPIAVLVVPAVYVAAARQNARGAAAAFGLGYLLHILGDALYPLVDLNFYHASFMLWPLVPPVEYEVEQSFAAHFRLLEPGPEFLFETGLFVAALLAWRADGYPGLATLRSWSLRAVRGVTGAES